MSSWKVVLVARLIIFLLSIACWLIGDSYDSSGPGSLFAACEQVGCQPTALDRAALVISAPLSNWDAVFFQTVAKDGYRFEQQYAMFPLAPIAARSVASMLVVPALSGVRTSILIIAGFDVGTIHAEPALSLAAVLVSLCCAVAVAAAAEKWCAAVLSRAGLSHSSRNHEHLAYACGVLMGLGPGGIFWSAGYSGTLHSLFVTLGLLALESEGFPSGK